MGKEERDRIGETEKRRQQYQRADTDGRLIMNLRDLSHTMRSLDEGKGSQRRILIILRETGKTTQRELTGYLGIQPGSASEVLAKLENAGLICRRPNQEDRRTTEVALTQEGERLACIATEERKKRHAEMFSCLSEGEKETLLALLQKVSLDWERRYPFEQRKVRGEHGPKHPHRDRD